MFPATRADIEVIPEGLPSPVTTGSVVGVADNHSSELVSLPTQGLNGPNAEGAQWNDDEDSAPSQGHLDPTGYDPNMSGAHPTQGVEERLAGDMTGAYGGMQAMDCADDYLSWLPSGGEGLAFGPDSVSPQGSFEHSSTTVAGIPVFPVTRRA